MAEIALAPASQFTAQHVKPSSLLQFDQIIVIINGTRFAEENSTMWFKCGASEMAVSVKSLYFFWWNVQSFAHFDDRRAGEDQWPIEEGEYWAKCRGVDRSLSEVFVGNPPEILAFAEITRQAAYELRDRLFPKYRVFSLDLVARPELQVAILYDPAAGLEEVAPLVVPGLPRGTRAMAVVDYVAKDQRIRFFACHWTARFSDQSMHHRSDTARYLNGEIYRFLNQERSAGEMRHVIILGDLNEEPYGLLEQRLHAFRDRGHARMRPHYTDEDVERVRLYNCAWRFIGERFPHKGLIPHQDTCGTYFWDKQNRWATPDHVIVDGSLLTETTPYLDEEAVNVVATPAFFGGGEKPRKFKWNNGKPSGMSDHLPILGRVVLQRES